MIKVLFVCLGNICRSPMGEAVFRHMVKESGLGDEITADSCGTAGYHTGETPHAGTKKILKRNGISYDGIRASKLEHRHFTEFDYIIAMDEQNFKDIVNFQKNKSKAVVCLLSEFASGDFISVPDPWYTGNFEQTYNLVYNGCEGLLAHIRTCLASK